MRKLIAFTLFCFFCLLITNEKAISKSNCDVVIKARIAYTTITDPEPETEILTNSFHQYDGFFKKL